MAKVMRVAKGLIITAVIFLTANFVGIRLQLNIDFITYTFMVHSLMIMLSILAILALGKRVGYSLALLDIKTLLKPVVIAVVVTIVINILMELVTRLLSRSAPAETSAGNGEVHMIISRMSPLQVFVFVFIYASIAEELLFRGFLQNYLNPLKEGGGIYLFRRYVSFPVIISALAFGLAHLTLLAAGASFLFLLRIILFTTCLGLIAGYYQEKHSNNAYAIIVHMAGNSLAVLGSFLIQG